MIHIHPGLFLIFGGIILTFFPKKLRQIFMVVIPALAFFFALNLPIGTIETINPLVRHEFVYLYVYNENYAFIFIFALMALLSGIYACHKADRLETFASMGYAGGALGVTLAGDWLTFLLFWEFMAITSVLLIWSSHTPKANASGMRYLFIHILGGSFLLCGVLMKIHTGVAYITLLTGTHDAASILIFLAFAVNGAIFPLHAWVPDAYPEAPYTGSVYLCSFTTKLTILCMLRVFAGTEILIYIGIISIFYGACFALIENNIRRLLSYHIISQLGFMIIDIGLGTQVSLNAASALAFGNILYKPLLFMCAGAILYATGIEKINQLGQLWKKMPVLTVCFFIAAFSIAGFPPFFGFTCKSISMFAAEQSGYHWIELLMILGSIGTALSIPFKMGYFIFFGKERYLTIKPIPKNMYVAMIAASGFCMLFGLCPQLFYSLLPFHMTYHPYNAAHLIEYLQLIPAALIPFIIYIKKMEPHTMLTIDTDWFARKPIWAFTNGLSKGLCYLEHKFGSGGRNFYHELQRISVDPVHKVIRRKPNHISSDRKDSNYYGDLYRIKIGDGMIGILVVVVILIGYFMLKRF